VYAFLGALYEKQRETSGEVNALLLKNSVKFYITWELYFYLIKFEVFTREETQGDNN
jgi:hypothetical protein